MEKKDTLLLLALAGAGAFAAFKNWDTIRSKLGFDDFYPGRIKAMQLAKDACTFEPPTANWVWLRDRAANDEIKLQGDPWRATELTKPKFRVTCTWVEDGTRVVHAFTVNIGNSSVAYEGVAESAPAPR
jgi:hypothetical protein